MFDLTLLRLRLSYFAYFAVAGILGPFLGPWLRSLGFDAAEIGLLSSVLPVAMAFVPPLWGALADHLGSAAGPLRVMFVAGAVALLPLPFVRGFTPIFATLALFAVFRAGAGPLLDSLSLTALEHRGRPPEHFARLRIWGSFGFVTASFAVAALPTGDRGPDALVAMSVLACQIAAALVGLGLPTLRRARTVDFRGDLALLLARNDVRALLLLAFVQNLALAPASLFYPVHLRANGGSSYTLAAFWAFGVAGEVLLFRFATPILRWIATSGLLLAGAVAVPLRLAALRFLPEPEHALPLQVLHALTFGAFYLGGVTWLAHHVPARLRATAQATFSAVGFGVATGLGQILGGWLYHRNGIERMLDAGILAGVINVFVAFKVVGRLAVSRPE